ncbi:site-specific integrase [Streptomyces sp. S3(2020)]|uniref:tyrosine-type recombinase/integrase n=1 Tax=Streptomyces sp. S3(2020) TaxID=2732044 RepID=UPI0014878AE1|nr:tyrosine-type recombinase/integrase [Streptomyces sp. S3(2020)]NNN34389.1 site-specific integrase [Streptomyces sp. S3(2020)]
MSEPKKPRRRGWGEGSVQEYETKAGKRWLIVYPYKDPQTGERKQAKRRGFTSATKAAKELRAKLAEVAAGTHRKPVRLTFRDYALTKWLTARKRRESTTAGYRDILTQYVLPVIGDKQLDEVTAADLERIYARLRTWKSTARGRKGNPLSLATQAQTHAIASSVFGYAARKGDIVANPALAVDDPPRAEKVERSVWTVAQAGDFLRATGSHRLAAAWRLLLATGLRRGELLGLTWDAVDLERGELRVRRTWIVVKGVCQWSKPKTAAGYRTIPLDAGTVAALRAHRAAQAAERLRIGAGWQDKEQRLFTDPVGEALHPETFSMWFRDLATAHSLPRIRLHELRHTYATMQLETGENVVTVSALLGHANPTITRNIYQHVLEATARKANDKVGALLDAPTAVAATG